MITGQSVNRLASKDILLSFDQSIISWVNIKISLSECIEQSLKGYKLSCITLMRALICEKGKINCRVDFTVKHIHNDRWKHSEWLDKWWLKIIRNLFIE